MREDGEGAVVQYRLGPKDMTDAFRLNYLRQVFSLRYVLLQAAVAALLLFMIFP
jgi:hypothetical protein